MTLDIDKLKAIVARPRCEQTLGDGMRALSAIPELIAEVERLVDENARLQVANASLIPGGMITATEIACLTVERDSARTALAQAERERDEARDRAERWRAKWERDYAGVQILPGFKNEEPPR